MFNACNSSVAWYFDVVSTSTVQLDSTLRLKSRGRGARVKVQQIFAHLRSDILHGRLKPGEPLPTQEQVARRFGSGSTTASIALQRLAHEGLVVRIPRRGSFVAEHRPTSLSVIDVVRAVDFPHEPDPQNPGQVHDRLNLLDHRINCAAREHNRSVRWHHLFENETAEPDVIARRFTGAQAVVALVRSSINRQFLARLEQARIPFAAIWISKPEASMLPEPAPYPQVTQNLHQMAELGTEHLIGLGYREIAFTGTAMQLTSGFLDAVTRHCLPMKAPWFVRGGPANLDETFLPRLRALLSSADRPRALVCATDHYAYDAATVAKDLGLSIPDDLALVACDEGPYWNLTDAPLTCVRSPHEAMFQKVVDMVLEQSVPSRGADRPLLECLALPGQLIVRQSCGARLKAPSSAAVARA